MWCAELSIWPLSFRKDVVMAETVEEEVLVEGASGAPEKAGGREALYYPLNGLYTIISPRI